MTLPNLIIYPWKLSVVQQNTFPDMASLRQSAFLSVTTTPDEISIVCEASYVSDEAHKVSNGWRCIGVEGPLDFSMVGILSPIALILAEAHISIFAISSFDTDYILVKEDSLANARDALENKNYHFSEK